jgi:uroporphyrinogen decarboxylase
MERIAGELRRRHQHVKVIAFARGAGLGLYRLAQSEAVDAIGLDWGVDLCFAQTRLQPLKPVQGNLDPLALIAGGNALDRSIDAIREAFGQGPHIFNLGHGIQPETPIAHVERLIERVRSR